MNTCDTCNRYNKKYWPNKGDCYGCRSMSKWEPKPITNYDRFTHMSIEELAKTCANYVSCHDCPIPYCKVRFTMERLGCIGNWIEWLQQEVDA